MASKGKPSNDNDVAVPHKKVVLKNEGGIEVNLEALPISISQTPPQSVAPPSCLASVGPLEDLNAVTYPEGIRRPKPELNIGTKGGNFRYDRDFLMQFMSVCKETPVFLFPLDAFGLDPLRPLSLTRGPDTRSIFMSGSIPFHNPLLQSTECQDVKPMPSHRTRSKRKGKKSEASKAVAPDAPNIEPTTLAQVDKAAAKENADKKEATQQRLRVSGGRSRRGGTRDDYPPQADGWSSVSGPRATVRAGDLSQFGKKDLKSETMTNSGSNMILEVQQESNKAAQQPPQRKKHVFQPRTKPVEDAVLTEEAADAKISEDVKEFFSIRNLDEAEAYFIALPPHHHHRLANKLVSSAVESAIR